MGSIILSDGTFNWKTARFIFTQAQPTGLTTSELRRENKSKTLDRDTTRTTDRNEKTALAQLETLERIRDRRLCYKEEHV